MTAANLKLSGFSSLVVHTPPGNIAVEDGKFSVVCPCAYTSQITGWFQLPPGPEAAYISRNGCCILRWQNPEDSSWYLFRVVNNLSMSGQPHFGFVSSEQPKIFTTIEDVRVAALAEALLLPGGVGTMAPGWRPKWDNDKDGMSYASHLASIGRQDLLDQMPDVYREIEEKKKRLGELFSDMADLPEE